MVSQLHQIMIQSSIEQRGPSLEAPSDFYHPGSTLLALFGDLTMVPLDTACIQDKLAQAVDFCWHMLAALCLLHHSHGIHHLKIVHTTFAEAVVMIEWMAVGLQYRNQNPRRCLEVEKPFDLAHLDLLKDLEEAGSYLERQNGQNIGDCHCKGGLNLLNIVDWVEEDMVDYCCR
jgi:hypothetical protein